MFTYQIDKGRGYEDVEPDASGIHDPDCSDPYCDGCWLPDSPDPEPWFQALEAEGTVTRARTLIDGEPRDEREF